MLGCFSVNILNFIIHCCSYNSYVFNRALEMYITVMTLSMCCVCCQTDEDGEIYMSVMQLRDQTDALQSEIDHRAKTGDTVGAEACQQQLTRVQQQLLEKNQIRSVGFFI